MEISDADLDALLAAVDMTGESLQEAVQASGDALMPLDDDGSSLSLLDESLWWMDDSDVAEESSAPAVNVAEERAVDAEESLQHQREQKEVPVKSGDAYARVVATRRRAKDELAHLRGRVQELEDQLEKARAHVAPASPCVYNASTRCVAEDVDMFWQRLAQSEREARQRTVAENLALRSQLEAQLRTARSLEKLLHKRPHNHTVTSPTASLSFKRLRVGADQDAVFASLIAELDTRYCQCANVFDESGLSNRRETFQTPACGLRALDAAMPHGHHRRQRLWNL